MEIKIHDEGEEWDVVLLDDGESLSWAQRPGRRRDRSHDGETAKPHHCLPFQRASAEIGGLSCEAFLLTPAPAV